ncbi:MAG TPA: TIGR00153 family protein [Gammaproteobacteria bacterium]|nr:TIGR00153 family protein [Gammaproteobacteria bacterium]
MRRYNPILNLFGRSPVKPLQEHMAKVSECVRALEPFFEAVIAGDENRMHELQESIARLENEADDLKHDLRLHLPRTLFLPVERRDLLEVLTMQDNIANRAKDLAGLVRGRRMDIPDAIGSRFLEFVRRSIDACVQAEKTVNELDELVETGFSGSEVDTVQTLINELDRLEKETDEIQVDIRARLFEIERDLPPVNVMFLYRLIDWTGDIGDFSQRVGSRLQLLLAK